MGSAQKPTAPPPGQRSIASFFAPAPKRESVDAPTTTTTAAPTTADATVVDAEPEREPEREHA